MNNACPSCCPGDELRSENWQNWGKPGAELGWELAAPLASWTVQGLSSDAIS